MNVYSTVTGYSQLSPAFGYKTKWVDGIGLTSFIYIGENDNTTLVLTNKKYTLELPQIVWKNLIKS